MATLCFQELMILSKTEKKARRIALSPKRNLILGENDVGKSTFIKALYHTLGADVPQLDNTRWSNARPIYCLKFSVSGITHYVVRDDKYFGLFNAKKQLTSRHRGISGADGIGARINTLLHFNIQLESQDGKLRAVPPAYYFLPFYTDQDHGWSTHWASFDKLQQFRNYRPAMLEYHLGIRPQAYYDSQTALHEANGKLAQISQEKNALISVRERYVGQRAADQVELDPIAFKEEVEQLVSRVNALYASQQEILTSIKEVRNSRIGVEQEIEILKHAISELESDYEYTEAPGTPDVIDCPTCGTEFHNSIANRFGLLDDIDYCRSLLDQKQKTLWDLGEKSNKLEGEYRKFDPQIAEIEKLLEAQRNDVTFKDVVRSEGYKDVLRTMTDQIATANSEQAELEDRVETLKKEMRADPELRKRVTEYYRAKMKEGLNALNVHVLSEDDYATPSKAIKANALGSDLPRSLLAQQISLLHAMQEFGKFVVCPLVIDSPLQQEQDDKNAKAIFEYIFSGALPDEQTIVGTLDSLEIREIARAVGSVTIVDLTEKYGLLVQSEYESVSDEVNPLHEETLRVPET
jgi:hypothetical protein